MNPKQSAEYENMLNAVRLRLDSARQINALVTRAQRAEDRVIQLETDKAALTHALKIARSALRGMFSVHAQEAVDFIDGVLAPVPSNTEEK